MIQVRTDAYIYSINRDERYAVIRFNLSDQEVRVKLDRLPNGIKNGNTLHLSLEIQVVGEITVVGEQEQGLVC